MTTNRTASTHFEPRSLTGWRGKWYRIIYFHEKQDERLFDLTLIGLILFSVMATILDTVAVIKAQMHGIFYGLEWFFTIVFTIEYILRLSVVKNPVRYARSFFGVIDLLAILPSYLELIFAGSGHLMVIRTLRVLRIFRILKLSEYTGASHQLLDGLYRSKNKILVFLLSVLILTTIFGSIMYLVEGPQNGFTSIPRGIYWAIVTMATVGFGDITPKTALGQFITSGIIIIGYGIIAVPTGIYSAELINSARMQRHLAKANEKKTDCPRYGLQGHEEDARFCRRCGQALPGTEFSPEAASPDSSDCVGRAPA
ncbi:MAG: ion transporter [Thiomonas sp. 20-64-5]|nr:MAG: ion transporter [Thiomonas sp. 20-64-5]